MRPLISIAHTHNAYKKQSQYMQLCITKYSRINGRGICLISIQNMSESFVFQRCPFIQTCFCSHTYARTRTQRKSRILKVQNFSIYLNLSIGLISFTCVVIYKQIGSLLYLHNQDLYTHFTISLYLDLHIQFS